jgi:hypothetical protein
MECGGLVYPELREAAAFTAFETKNLFDRKSERAHCNRNFSDASSDLIKESVTIISRRKNQTHVRPVTLSVVILEP